MTLEPHALDLVRRTWAARLTVPVATFESTCQVFVPRADSTTVVVVELGTSLVVLGPPATLSPLRRTSRSTLVDLNRLLETLSPFTPAALGAATLSFADTIGPEATSARAATDDDVHHVLSECTADERSESGLDDMSSRVVVHGPDGRPVALAGYEEWDGALAHLGVAAVPGARGTGAGSRAARAAAQMAVDNGLVAQWRCRRDHTASARLAQTLGFTPLGVQLAVEVQPA